MKKHGMYSFLPHETQYRTSFFNPLNYFYNLESCYLENDFHLREQILIHRNSVHFNNDLLLLDSSWFSADFDVAFENVNQDSYLLSPQYKPRQRIALNDFRVVESEYLDAKWEEIRQLEIDIGDFLLIRNKVIAKNKIEHLNDPMNYFFLDLKSILRSLVRESNVDFVLDVIDSLSKYISYVETELPFDSQDRMFISQVRDLIKEDIESQINGKVNNDNLRSKFHKLTFELHRVIDVSNRVSHFSFQDFEINPHATSSFELIHDEALQGHPTLALIECAKNQDDSVASLSSNSELNFAPDLLDRCDNVNLIEGLSLSDRENYIHLVSKIYRMVEYKTYLTDILKIFDDTGQIELVQNFAFEMEGFIEGLIQEIKAVRLDIEKVDFSNKAIKNKLLKDNFNQNYFDKTVGYLGTSAGLFSTPVINTEQFIINQDIRHLTESNKVERVFDDALNRLEELSGSVKSLSHSYQASSVRQIAGGTMLELAMESEEHEDSYAFNYQCNPLISLNENTFSLDCYSEDFHALYTLNGPLISDFTYAEQGIYELKSCQFNGGDEGALVHCENEHSSLNFSPNNALIKPNFLSLISQQLSLGLVLFQLGKNTFQWTFNKSDKPQALEESIVENHAFDPANRYSFFSHSEKEELSLSSALSFSN